MSVINLDITISIIFQLIRRYKIINLVKCCNISHDLTRYNISHQ